MSLTSAEWFKQGARMWQTTDKSRYGTMRSNRRNRMRCRKRFRLKHISSSTVLLGGETWDVQRNVGAYLPKVRRLVS